MLLRGGLAALCLVSQLSVRSRGALLRRLGLRRCACDSNCSMGGLALRYPRPSFLPVRNVQGASMLPVIDLAPRGEDGMVASVEETEPSAISTTARAATLRPSPRAPRAGLSRGKIIFRFFYMIRIYNLNVYDLHT